MASIDNFSNIYAIIKELFQTLDQKVEGVTETVAIKDTKGNLLCIITCLIDDTGYLQLSIMEDIDEFISFIAHLDAMIEFPNQPLEALMMRKGIEIKFIDRDELPGKHYQAIKKSGVTFRGKGNWPYLIEFYPRVIVDSLSKEKEAFLTTTLNMLARQENRDILLQTFLETVNEPLEMQDEGLPVLIWDSKTKRLSTSQEHLVPVSEEVPSLLEAFFPQEEASLLIPEFTVYRLEKQISSRSPHFYEISLRFGERVYHHDDGRDYLEYELAIADPEEGLVFLEQFDGATPQQLQEALLEFLAFYEEDRKSVV